MPHDTNQRPTRRVLILGINTRTDHSPPSAAMVIDNHKEIERIDER